MDLILNDQWAIEIIGTNAISEKHLKGLRSLKEEGVIRNFAVVSCDPYERITRDGISIFPWEVFLERLWRGEFFGENEAISKH